MLSASRFTQSESMNWLSFIIPFIHLLGGFLIIIGLLTRWAVIVQIPILIGAIIFVNAKRGIFAGESELFLSILIFLLLVLFFIEGGEPLSLDNYFRKNPR